ncbi:hypothetical protein FHT79_002726 [Rhizobium sp. BK212]|uniref:hypothetical protein n=1 Tax=Rhizobium sp. BK212 TaxID=2587074 RepID=UPI0017B711C5|nr:hypothetical protein [Rhizobium sp. BK212]MBB4215557.1 hypothetical protein [Rhizobium sp. BK212]
MGFIFGGDTGQSQADVTDARKRLAAAMLQQGTDTSPIKSPWEGAARMAQALMGGLAIRQQGEDQRAADAQVISAITGQPYTPPEKPAGLLSSIFGGGNKPSTPGATGSSMPKVDAAGNVAMASTGGGLPSSFLAAVDKTEGAGDYDTLFGHAQKNGPFAGTAISQMPIRDVLAFTDPSGPYAQYVKDKVGRVATPVGKYQTVGTTLRNAVGALGLDPNAPYDQATQDRVASYLARQRIASADTLPGKIQALRAEWQGFKNVPDAEMAQIVADLQSGAMAPTGGQVASAAPAPPLQPPPVNVQPAAPTPAYVDPRVTTAGRPDAPPVPTASAPSEVASLDPSIGIPMPGAAGQMRASDPAQVMPPQGAPQAALSPLPTSTVGPAPNVASVPSLSQDRSGVGMGGDVPGQGYFPPAPTGGGQPASPQQIAQAQHSGQARLAQALDNAPQQAQNPMANPRVQALVQAITNPNASPQVKAMAAQQLQILTKPPEYGFETLPDGTVLRSDPRTGTLTPVYRSEMSQADRAKLDFDREKFQQEQANRNTPTATEQANIDLERNKFDLEKNKPVVVQSGETLFSPGQERVVYQGTGYKPEDVSNLRKEVQNLPTYKSYQQAAPVFQSMIDTAKTDSKASDLNLVYGLGKIMDPNSVVREGEMVMVNNTASLPDWFSGIINSVNGGQRLTPETRQAILAEARSRMGAYRGALDNDIGQYRGIISRRGMNEADVLPTLGDIAEVPSLTPPPAAGIGAPPEGVPADVWGAMTPAERKLWQK